MFYREAGQFRTSYAQDSQLLPLRQDRIGMAILLFAAFVVVPFIADTYWLSAILIPWLILSLVAMGQNILMGYAGQLSLGSAGFMAAGAFACYNIILRIDGIPFVVAVLLSGVCAALVGIVFGLPSLRIRGLYLAVATLASQFFIVWALDKFGWFKNYDPAGVITAQKIVVLGYEFTSPVEKYLVVLAIVCVLTLLAKNMARGSIGRGWMAVRDMDVAAEVTGLSLLRTKLQAFAISSFYCGVGGALYAFAYLQTVEPSAFTVDLSFRILFMAILGGLGTIIGSFAGNPARITSISDLRERGARVATRQEGSGSALLFSKLVADAGFRVEDLALTQPSVTSETDIAIAVREGKADAGLAIEAVAREQGLDFVALHSERFDLVVRRREYFESPMQRLLDFTRTDAFRIRADLLGGYDVSNVGGVVFNPR